MILRYQKAVIFFTLLLFFIIPLTTAEESMEGKTIICEDGEKYTIQEKIIQASNQPAPKDEIIIVNARKLRLIFYRDGKPFKTYPVSIGEPKTPTPIGEWKVIHKGGNWGSGFGVRWIGINVPWGIYGIHGTNKPWTIGQKASHGCVRLLNRDVLELYNIVKLGTPVHIIGDLPVCNLRKELGKNNTGKDVVLLQFALRKAGFNPGSADGRFGNEMELAVYKFQYYYGLTMTGKITLNEEYLLDLR